MRSTFLSGFLRSGHAAHPCSAAAPALPSWPAGALAAAFFASVALAGCEKKAEAPPPPGANTKIQVSVVTLHPRSVAVSVDVPGRTIAAVSADIRPQVNGILQTRLFKEGSEVKAGDLLYQIDPATYQADYDSAVATQQKNEAALNNAQIKQRRAGELLQRNAGSQATYDDANSELLQAKASVAQAIASVETARINLNYTKITAPITGRIDASIITPGALLTANQSSALATIRQLDPMNVDVTDSITNLLQMQAGVKSGKVKLAGDNITVKLKLDDGTTYPHNGTLSFLESNVSETTGTFVARAAFPNPDRTLLPGMYVRALVEVGLAPNSFVVPQRAVTFSPQGQAKAFFVGSDGRVSERTLTVAENVGNGWRVTNGVSDGDKVVVEGTMLVRDGQEVSPVEVTIDDATGDVRRLQQTSSLETLANERAAHHPKSAD